MPRSLSHGGPATESRRYWTVHGDSTPGLGQPGHDFLVRLFSFSGRIPARMDFAGSAPKDVEIYNVTAVGALLGDALQNDLGLLPFYVFGFLCGIRPENELESLEWRYVHLDKRKHVAIPATISKTHKYREVDLSSNAVAWLREYKARGGQMEGKVVQWEHENLRKHRKASAERVNVQWIQDGMRHS